MATLPATPVCRQFLEILFYFLQVFFKGYLYLVEHSQSVHLHIPLDQLSSEPKQRIQQIQAPFIER